MQPATSRILPLALALAEFGLLGLLLLGIRPAGLGPSTLLGAAGLVSAALLGLLVLAPQDRRAESGAAAPLASGDAQEAVRRRLERLNRTYILLSAVNHQILRLRPPQEIFEEACRIAVEQGGFRMAWIGLVDPETREVRPRAMAGHALDYLDGIHIRLGGPGPTAAALESGAHMVVDDIATDPRMAPWKDAALAHGFRSSGSFPLMIDGQPRGTLNLYASEPHVFDAEELRLIDEMVGDIAFALDLSERDEARRRMETQLSMIYGSISDILFYLAVEGPDRYRFLSVNPAFLQATGLREEQVVGRLVHEVIPPPALPVVLGKYAEALRTLKRVEWEEVSKYPSGVRRGEVSIVPILDGTGTCTRLLGTVHDLTERVAAEEALRQSETRYRTVFLGSPMGIALIDSLTAHYYDVNPAYEAITGRAREELLRTDWKAITHPDDIQPDLDNMARLNAGEIPGFTMSKRLLRPDGAVVWTEMTIAPLREEGGPRRHLAMIQDITERRRAEERQAGQTRILQMVAQGSSLESILVALESFIEGQSGRALCSVVLLDATGRRISACLSPSLPPYYTRSLVGLEIGPAAGSCGTAMHTGRSALVQDIETDPLWADYRDLIRPHGLRACSSWPILGSGGQVLGSFALYFREPVLPSDLERQLVALSTDLAGLAIERRRAEEEIRALNTDLELRVDQRTAQLEAANKELEAFSYSVSHDLRAPLRAISGFATILSRRHMEGLNGDGRHALENIVQASGHMGRLIEDLLNYSKLGRAGVRQIPVPLDGLMADLRKNLQQRIEETGSVLEVQSGLPTVLGDPTLLGQIFINLLDNALTYRKPDAPARVRVSGEVSGEQAVVRVQDEGIGIPAEYQEKIFNMFQRLHSQDEYPGTGIGLANVRKSVQLLGGTVSVDSRPGEGSTFTIRLPKG